MRCNYKTSILFHFISLTKKEQKWHSYLIKFSVFAKNFICIFDQNSDFDDLNGQVHKIYRLHKVQFISAKNLIWIEYLIIFVFMFTIKSFIYIIWYKEIVITSTVYDLPQPKNLFVKQAEKQTKPSKTKPQSH